jgi:DNA-binding MarR family transcriptional regulator
MDIKEQTNLIRDGRIGAYGRLLEAQRRLNRVFDRSLREQVGISSVWYEALLRLGRSPQRQMSISQLGEQVVLTSGGATRLVDRLEEVGYIERVACPSDRRVQWVRLTEPGLAILIAATEVHLGDLEEHFSSHLTVAEMATLTDLLDRIRSGADDA